MNEPSARPLPFCKPFKPVLDVLITLAAWTYFTAGFVFFYSPFYAWAAFFSKDGERSFQRLNHIFFSGFFRLLGLITPGLSFRISDDVRAIHSSVIVSNHLSYLDPILLVSLFPRHKTLVKGVFFRFPIFGWVLKRAGYFPSASGGEADLLMLAQMEKMEAYIADGGNLFIFPEGTRSRDGRIGRFSKGAFKIARRCNAPIAVLRFRNTDRLFRPGRFRFHTCVENTIVVEKVGEIAPDEAGSVNETMARVREILVARD